MILEVATLNVRAGESDAFEQAFSQAESIISSMPGYVSHQLQRCLEARDKYLLLVQWQRLEDHTIGFRQSRQYQDWKKLLHHFYEPFPTVEHYEPVFVAQHGVELCLAVPALFQSLVVNYEGTNMKPTYFDLTVHDVAQARKFFEEIFGWQFERFPMPYEYYRIQAGSEGEPGIDGGIGAVKDTPIAGGTPATQLTVPVVNLDEAIARVQASGGRVIEPKMPIPGIGWYATCAEPGGLRFGIIQADPTAK